MVLPIFIFQTGTWIGEGKISFSSSPEFIKFYTKWQINEEIPGQLKALQIVEMQEVEEHVVNSFTFLEILDSSFTVILENEMIGKITGKGIKDERSIAWEFRNQEVFEGFEVYEQQENGDYSLYAEYTSADQFRTIIQGLIWKKN